ncbi:MAG TPA: 4-(cytidine 5'-diphospho)-2-C-methyl-D-erythritol kinase [Mycobacteriales bacterium]|nr:4-(cytidine 5'-diphospho)-2-C-methyl-D-erythritol kinase [Mycobacteriales bacterium]
MTRRSIDDVSDDVADQRSGAGESAPVTVRVPAKVNLHLGVGELRPDGFHELTTVFQAVSLYDEILVEPARRLTVEVIGDGAEGVPRGDENLAVQAARAVAALAGRAPGVRITIRKGIPVAGGMAGGSADAAAALVACDALWGAGLDRASLARLAAGLGSDVPFALRGGNALGTGRGERLSPVLGRGNYHWVFALADGGLSTPGVYQELDRQRAGERAPEPARPDGVMAALRAGDPVALGRALANDLQPAALALRPQLRRVLDAGRELGAVGSIVCGSGPTVALLARGPGDAINLAAVLAGMDVCRAVRRAAGPVVGARVHATEPGP